MNLSYLDLLNLRKFSKGWRTLGWIVLGPPLSLFLADVTLLVLMWVSGGIHIDTRGTPFQEFVSQLIFPIVALVSFGGVACSLRMAVRCWRQKE